ncbi:HTH domain-containing protein [Ignavigranum ruoffiae]|uniref:BglG family transcription antiterminator n=1 Tax=Ignavigranum ruoffiae TaxID=89093 RepID=UPI0023537637|nr:HTH domain-containing protein [Ignavigranum ruoffiae]
MSLLIRWYEILNLLLTQKTISLENLEDHLNLSSATVKKSIDLLNQEIAPYAEIIEQSSSYFLKIYDYEKFDLIKTGSLKKQADYNSTTKRKAFLLSKLLASKTPLTILDFAELLDVSKGTVSNDLKSLKQDLSHYDINVISIQNKGIDIAGSELDLRLAYINYALDFFNYTYIDQVLIDFIINLGDQYKIKKRNILLLIKSLETSLFRLRNQHFLQAAIPYYSADILDHPFFEEFFAFIENHEKYTLSNFEKSFLTYPLNVDDSGIIRDCVDINKALIEDMSRQVLTKINQVFLLEIPQDSFVSLLGNHLYYLVHRAVFKYKLDDLFHGEIQKKYPFSYSLAKYASEEISEYLDLVIDPIEIDYLTFYFELIIREFSLNQAKKIAIICNTGYATAGMIKHQIQNVVGHDIEIVQFSEEDYYEEDLTDFLTIITMIPLSKIPNNIPTIRISNIFNDEYLSREWQRIIKQTLVFPKYTHFDLQPLPAEAEQTYEEHLSQMVGSLQETYQISADMLARLKSKYHDASLLFGSGIAFPHEVDPNINQLILSVGVLPQSIEIENERIELIILLIIPENILDYEEHDLLDIYDLIFEIAQNEEIKENIKACQTKEDLIKYLQRRGYIQ